MAGEPDPKPPPRRKDPKARKKAHLANDECVICERSDVPLNVHHVLYGADGRHDDPRNFIMACGSGTTGCHGLAHAADPMVLAAIGRHLAEHPEKIRYAQERLGKERGLDYLRRRYGLIMTSEVTPDPKPVSAKRERR